MGRLKGAMSTKTEAQKLNPANRIRELRKAKGWTLRMLGDRVGLSVQQISNLELGNRRLNDFWMRQIADAFSVRPHELLEAGAGEPASVGQRVYDAAHDVLTSLALHDLVSLSQHEIDRLSTVLAQVVKLHHATDEEALRAHIERTVVDLQDYRAFSQNREGPAAPSPASGKRKPPHRKS